MFTVQWQTMQIIKKMNLDNFDVLKLRIAILVESFHLTNYPVSFFLEGQPSLGHPFCRTELAAITI